MDEHIILAHGGGGLLSSELISKHISSRFSNSILDRMDDSGVLPQINGRIAFTTDSYTVSPVFFPGGNIGDLAVCGTVNDVAMSGAKPKYLSLALIIEEGFEMNKLEDILDSIKKQSAKAGVAIVTGDTKVVPKGQVDSIFINTAGIGEIPEGVSVSSANVKDGDALVVSGPIGVHGLAVMMARENFKFATGLESDVAPLNGVVAALVESGLELRTLRDLTRGGLAMALYDIAGASDVTARIEQASIPMLSQQEAACEILGLDLLHIAAEGCFISVVPQEQAQKCAEIMKSNGCPKATVIGTFVKNTGYRIEMITTIGSTRVVTPPRGELLPRIC